MRQPSGEHATVRFIERDASGRHRVVRDHAADELAGTIDRAVREPRGRPGDDIAAGDAEQVVCSCRAHGGVHERNAVEQLDSARK